MNVYSESFSSTYPFAWAEGNSGAMVCLCTICNTCVNETDPSHLRDPRHLRCMQWFQRLATPAQVIWYKERAMRQRVRPGSDIPVQWWSEAQAWRYTTTGFLPDAPAEYSVALTVNAERKHDELEFMFSMISGRTARIPATVPVLDALEYLHAELDVPAKVLFTFLLKNGDLLLTPPLDSSDCAKVLQEFFHAADTDRSTLRAGPSSSSSTQSTTDYCTLCNACHEQLQMLKLTLKEELREELRSELLAELLQELR